MSMRCLKPRTAPRPLRRARLGPDIGALLFELRRCRGKPPLGELPLQPLDAPAARKELRLEPALFKHADRADGQHFIAFKGGIGAAMPCSHNLTPPRGEMSGLGSFSEIHFHCSFAGASRDELPVLHRRALLCESGNEALGLLKRRRSALHGDSDGARSAQDLRKALG